MKKLLLVAALAASATAVWANNPTPVTQLSDGGRYFIYDAYGDDGTTNEQALNETCRYCFRYDDGEVIRGTHTKPASAANGTTTLEEKHVWVAYKAKDDGAWMFRNVATNKWIYINDKSLDGDEGIHNTLVPTDDAGKFYVVSTYAQTCFWDGSEAEECKFVWWYATDKKHPYSFYAARPADDGNGYTIFTPTTWTTDPTPFRTSSVENPTWQAWFMHTAYEGRDQRYTMTFTPNDPVNVHAYRSLRTDMHSDYELWAFVPVGHFQYKIYNKAAGMSKALKIGADGATFVPEHQATTWEVVASTSRTNTETYFCFRAVGTNTYANLQWVDADADNPVGLLKTWHEADNGSTGWIEAPAQPILDYYTDAATFNATRPAVEGVVGDYTSSNAVSEAQQLAEQARQIVATVDPYNITAEQIASLRDLKNRFDALPRVAFDLTKSYRLYNTQSGTYMSLNASDKLVGNGTRADENGVTFFPAPGGGDRYYLSMGPKYFRTVTTSRQVGVTDKPTDVYTLSTYGTPYTFVIKGGANDKTFLHEGADRNIIGWLDSAAGSSWYLEAAGAAYANLEEVGASSDATTTIYDLQGRRVANPTSGLYIINGRKALVK